MNRLLQRCYAWLLPIGPMRLGWERRNQLRWAMWELTLHGEVTLPDASGSLVTYGSLPRPPRRVPVDDPPA